MFDLVCEIEPPTRPDLRRVRHQIGVLAPVAHSFPHPRQPHAFQGVHLVPVSRYREMALRLEAR